MTEQTKEPHDVPDQADLHKHLEFVQAIIARLANNSFLIKGWSLTVAIAFFGYAVANLRMTVALLCFVPPLSFWFLDSYFLRKERMFRMLHDDVAQGGVPKFSLSTKPYAASTTRWNAHFSKTLTAFYVPILVVALAILIAAVLEAPT